MADDQNKPVDNFQAAGVTGLKRLGGRVYEEWLSELQGEPGRRVIRQMIDSDPIVGASLLAIDLLCRNVKWNTVEVSNKAEDVDAAQFLDECRTDMSSNWQDTVSEILSFVWWGFQYSEIVYKIRGGKGDDPTRRSKYDDNRIGWRKITPRAQETLWEWVFDDDGGVKAMKQMAPPDFTVRTIPIEKALLFRVRSRKGNPEPPGILRNIYEDWYNVRNLSRIEAIGIEKEATGTLVFGVPPKLMAVDATPEQKAAYESFKKAGTDFHVNEQMAFIIPLSYDKDGNKIYNLEIIKSSGPKSMDVDKSIQRHKHAMAMAMLNDVILLGTQTIGNRGLSEGKYATLSVALGTFLDIIEDVFNTHAVPRLFSLNTFNVKQYPTIKHGKIETVDIERFTKAVLQLSQSGAITFPDADIENDIRDKMEWERLSQQEIEQRRAPGGGIGVGGEEGGIA